MTPKIPQRTPREQTPWGTNTHGGSLTTQLGFIKINSYSRAATVARLSKQQLNWLKKRLNSCEKMSKKCTIILSADVFTTLRNIPLCMFKKMSLKNVFVKVCDRIRYPTMISIIGNASMAIAFLLLGPVPFIKLEPSVALIQVVYYSIIVSEPYFIAESKFPGVLGNCGLWLCSSHGVNIWTCSSSCLASRLRRRHWYLPSHFW